MEESGTRLDENFDSLLLEMKPYVMSMTDRIERQRCAAWIKKLCQYNSGTSAEKKNRNSYAQLMFHLLKRSGLDSGVFAGNPPDGSLAPLSQSSISSTMAGSNFSSDALATKYGGAPNWVETELDDTSISAYVRTSSPKRSASMRVPPRYNAQPPLPSYASETPNNQPWRSNELEDTSNKPPIAYQLRSQFPSQNGDGYGSASSMYQEARTQSLTKIHEREIEAQKTMFENKLQEDKARLEQQHEREVKRVLEQKTREVEECHREHQKKVVDLETKSRELAEKLLALQGDAEAMRRGKDRQIAEVKSLAQTNLETLQREYEERISGLNGQFEMDRESLEEAHAQSIQQLLDDTSARLKKMEHEYTHQTSSSAKLIGDLEARVGSQAGELERAREERFVLERRNMELEYEARTLNDGFQELKTRLEKFESKYSDAVDSFRKDKAEVVLRYEGSTETMKHSHAERVEGLMGKLCEMDDRMLSMKQQLQDKTLECDRMLKEAQSQAHTDLVNCQQGYEKRLKELQLNYDLDSKEWGARVQRAEEGVRERQAETDKLIALHRRETDQSQAAFETFKQQVDESHSRVYEEMRGQMDRIETDLTESKTLREQQSVEYDRSIKTLKCAHEKMLVEVRARHEEDKARLCSDWSAERQQLMERHEQSVEAVRNKLEQRIATIEVAHKTELKKRDKHVAELESTRERLSGELQEAETLRKQQLLEVGLKMEQMKQKFAQERELLNTKARTAADNERKQLMETHDADLRDAVSRFRAQETQLVSEWTGRVESAQETAKTLQGELDQWKQQVYREQAEQEGRLEELNRRHSAQQTAQRQEHTTRSVSTSQHPMHVLLKLNECSH